MNVIRIRERMARIGVNQERLAREVGVHASQITRYFRGDRQPPRDFEARVTAALDRLEKAERAADRARQRVLAGGAA